MTMFIDSHAHLADPAFDADRDAVIERALAAGARAIVCIGESIAAAARAATIAAAHPGFVFSTAGVHPHDAAEFDPLAIPTRSENSSQAARSRSVNVGSTTHYDHSPRDLQRRAFAAQLALARELDRPVVVHTREAEDDTRAMVAEAGAAGVRGVLHCYTGSHALAETALAVGWYVSFSGIVTFKKWDDDALLRLVPTIAFSSNRTRRTSRRCRIAESGTSRRGLVSRRARRRGARHRSSELRRKPPPTPCACFAPACHPDATLSEAMRTRTCSWLMRVALH